MALVRARHRHEGLAPRRHRSGLKAVLSLATAATLALALGGWARSVSAVPAPRTLPTVTMGTTDFIVSADPAGAYDLPSWTLIYNVYQTLLQVPAGTTKI